MNKTIAYYINMYPAPSIAFVRREIRELETIGFRIKRYAARRFRGPLVDEVDRLEASQTSYILDCNFIYFIGHVLRTIALHPVGVFRAVIMSIRSSTPTPGSICRSMIYLAEACVLMSWTFRDSVSHIHAHFGTNATTIPMLCHTMGGPTFSFTVHGPEEFDKVQAIALTKKIQESLFVIAVTEFCRSQLFRWCSYEEWSKIYIVHCGLDDCFLAHPVSSVPETNTLVCIGRLCEQKGQILLIEAARVLRDAGRNFMILFVGDGDMRPQIEFLINKYLLKDYCRILGWLSSNEIKDVLINARAMVLPSLAEGLPVVIMESLALTRPVVTTWIAGIPELMENGRSGWLIPPGSVDALTKALCELLDSPRTMLDSMGVYGADLIRCKHNIHIEAGKLACIFEEYTSGSEKCGMELSSSLHEGSIR